MWLERSGGSRHKHQFSTGTCIHITAPVCAVGWGGSLGGSSMGSDPIPAQRSVTVGSGYERSSEIETKQ